MKLLGDIEQELAAERIAVVAPSVEKNEGDIVGKTILDGRR